MKSPNNQVRGKTDIPTSTSTNMTVRETFQISTGVIILVDEIPVDVKQVGKIHNGKKEFEVAFAKKHPGYNSLFLRGATDNDIHNGEELSFEVK
jgi:hypothetical protein